MADSMIEDDAAGPCGGSGEWVPYGWAWYPCPVCDALVYRGPGGLVEHRRGERGEKPDLEKNVT